MRSHPAVFSSTLLPHDVAGLAETLAVVREDGWRRTRLHGISTCVREELTTAGLDLRESRSHIVALVAGNERQTITLRDALEQQGIFGSVFFPPATPRNRSLVRLSLHAALTDTQVRRIIDTCVQCCTPLPQQR